MQTIIKRFLPFLMLGMMIVLFTFGFILFVYLFLIGSAIGLVLFSIQWIKNKWQQKHNVPNTKNNKRTTRIIDISDWKRH